MRRCSLLLACVILAGCHLLPTMREEPFDSDEQILPLKRTALTSLPIARSLAFSPDGKYLASEHLGRVAIRNAATGRVVKEIKTGIVVQDIVYLKDGQHVFLRGYHVQSMGRGIPPHILPEACIYNLASGEITRRFIGNEAEGISIASDRLSSVTRGDERSTIKIVSLLDPKAKPVECRIHDHIVRVPTLAADQRRVAFVDEDSNIRIRDLTTGSELARFQGHQEPILRLEFTPDGMHLVSVSGGDFKNPVNVFVWDLAKNAIHLRLKTHDGPFNHFEISDDSRYLAVGIRAVSESTDVTIWRLSDGAKLRTLEKLAWNTPVAFTPDGSRLAIVEYNGKTRIVPVDSPSSRQ